MNGGKGKKKKGPHRVWTEKKLTCYSGRVARPARPPVSSYPETVAVFLALFMTSAMSGSNLNRDAVRQQRQQRQQHQQQRNNGNR